MSRATTATQRIKTVLCRECNQPMEVGRNARTPQRCVECGIKAFRANQEALQSKSGTAYERWRNALLRSLDK